VPPPGGQPAVTPPPNADYVGHRKVALRHHCRLAIETLHPRFGWLASGGAYSVVLTVNSGYE
jgi:hypothetical protein